MKRLLLISLVFLLVGCQDPNAKSEFEAFQPEKEVSVNQDFIVDSTAKARVTRAEILDATGEDVLIVSYSFINDGKARTAMEGLHISAKQNGVSLTPSLDHVEDKDLLVSQVEGGESLENIEQGFILDKENEDQPVTLSFQGNETTWFDENKKPTNSYPINLKLNTKDLPRRER